MQLVKQRLQKNSFEQVPIQLYQLSTLFKGKLSESRNGDCYIIGINNSQSFVYISLIFEYCSWGSVQILLNWCCMCKPNGQLVQNFLLHCTIIRELWSFTFPLKVSDVCFYWKGFVEGMVMGQFWNGYSSMYHVDYLKDNNNTFNDAKLSMVQLKSLFLINLLKWMLTFGCIQFSSLLSPTCFDVKCF